jgi:hypothetical protein
MCGDGPGLRESVLDGGTWTTTKLSGVLARPLHEDRQRPGRDGPDRVVRLQVGLRALTRVVGVDTLAPGRDAHAG